jgi:hypothetical protein
LRIGTIGESGRDIGCGREDRLQRANHRSRGLALRFAPALY